MPSACWASGLCEAPLCWWLSGAVEADVGAVADLVGDGFQVGCGRLPGGVPGCGELGERGGGRAGGAGDVPGVFAAQGHVAGGVEEANSEWGTVGHRSVGIHYNCTGWGVLGHDPATEVPKRLGRNIYHVTRECLSGMAEVSESVDCTCYGICMVAWGGAHNGGLP